MGRFERKKEKKKKFWTNIFLAAMFVFVVVGMSLGGVIGGFGGGTNLKYGDYKFYIKEGDNHYWTKIDGNEMPFYFLPSQVEHINVSSIISNRLREAYLVMITFNPKDTVNLQAMEITRFDLSQHLGKVVYNGVLESSLEYNIPIITCENATAQAPVIVLNMSDNTSIQEVDNCIYLYARGTGFLSLRDRLLYSYHGVIEDE